MTAFTIDPQAARFIEQYDDAKWRLRRRVVALIVLLPLLGAVPALAWLLNFGMTPLDVALFVGFYLWTGFGITIGYHRLTAHRAFACAAWVRTLLLVGGAMAWQGPVLRWAADHRRHHAATDRPGDPHTPYRGDERVSLRGLVYAHFGWFFDRARTSVRRIAPDLLDDPLLRALDRHYLACLVASLALPAVLGYAFGSLHAACSALLIGGVLRIVAVQHVTWLVNSLGHAYGTRPFAVADHSVNNVALTLLALGEGLHNNHHAFPSSADNALLPGQIDLSGLTIRALAKLGLAYDVRRPNATQVHAHLSQGST